MGLLDGVRRFFSGIASGDIYAMYIYVRCQRCGEMILRLLQVVRGLNPRGFTGWHSRTSRRPVLTHAP